MVGYLGLDQEGDITLGFSLLLKNYFECSFVSLECSLQSSSVCFEVCSEYLYDD